MNEDEQLAAWDASDSFEVQKLNMEQLQERVAALEFEGASLRATLENAADLAQEVDDLRAELDTLRALVVKKDEALQRIKELKRQLAGDHIWNEQEQEIFAITFEALRLTPADLVDSIVISRAEYDRLKSHGR